MPADAPSLPFPAKGSLKRVPFTQLIRELSRSKITGNLYLLTEGNKKKVVFFDAGVPVFVRSNQISETLGQTLAQDGLITQEQCDNTLESVRRTGKRQGELLVEHGILSRGNLQYGLLRQLRIKLLEIFAWEDGRFQFKEGGERPDTSDAELEEPTEALIIAGVQERYTDERARGLLAELAGRYPLVNRHYRDRLDELDLLPEEQFVLSTLDGSRKVEDVLKVSPAPPVPLLSTLLLGAIEAGVVDCATTRSPPRPRPKAPDFTPKPPDDDALRPSFDATSAIKEFEDTPLPRQLPDANTHDQLPTLLTEDEEMFAGVALGDDEGDTGDDLAADIEEPERSSPGQLLGRISDLMVDDDDEPEEATRAEINPIELDAEPTRAAATFINDLVEIGAGDDDIIELIDDDEMVELAADEEDEALEDDDATRTADADAVAEEALEPEPEPDEALDESLEELSSIEQLDEPSDELAAVSLETIGDVAGLTYEDLAAEAAAARIEGEAAALDPDDELPDLDDIDADLLDLDVDDDLLADLDAPLDTLAGDGELDAPEREPDAPVRREELVDFAELDDIDIDLDVLGGQAQGGPPSVVEEPTQRDYEEGQMLFNEGVSAMHEGDYAAALSRFEEAYDHGLDDAELRAMIAFARYRHNGGDETTAAESLEQLEYAEQMNPDLDLIYAYRGAIYLGLGIEDSARESFKYALQLNPDCELANDFINNM